ELRILRKTMEAAKKQNRTAEETKNKGADEVKILNEEMSKLKAQIQNLESEHSTKEKEIKSAEANSVALKNQSEGFLLEYDRLLAENEQLRDQLRSIDESVSHSNGKKNM
nr:B-cell receptor-associated protein 31-like [Tanacetum cinerariifolium]